MDGAVLSHYDFVACLNYHLMLVVLQIHGINSRRLLTLFNCNTRRLFTASLALLYCFVHKIHFDFYGNLTDLHSRNVAFVSCLTKMELNCLQCHATITSIRLASKNGFGSTLPARSASTTFSRAATLFDQPRSSHVHVLLYMSKHKAIAWTSAWFEKIYGVPPWSNIKTRPPPPKKSELWILLKLHLHMALSHHYQLHILWFKEYNYLLFVMDWISFEA